MTTNGTLRRNQVSGELLPPTSGALVPWNDTDETPTLANSPLIRINLPARAPEAPGPILEQERRIPVAQPTFTSHVGVPVAQAFISAVAAAIVLGVMAWCFRWEARVVLFGTGLVFAGAWVHRMRWADTLLWSIERITGWDVNHDGSVGDPHPPVLLNPLQAQQDARREVSDEQVNAEKDELLKFLHLCYVKGCSESAHGLTRGSGAARDAYLKRRDTLFALGVACWKNEARPSAGWKLAVSHERAAQLVQKHILGGM